jgi:dipeptidyl-peptidase-4
MGLPKDNAKDYDNTSATTFADGLKGNLLIVHGTGDDNVHYQQTEVLINKLIAANKVFTVMPYPNRTHSINEGQGSTRHLYSLLKRYLNENLPLNSDAAVIP